MKTRGNQVVMPLNVAKMIEKSDQVFKMAEILDGLLNQYLFLLYFFYLYLFVREFPDVVKPYPVLPYPAFPYLVKPYVVAHR